MATETSEPAIATQETPTVESIQTEPAAPKQEQAKEPKETKARPAQAEATGEKKLTNAELKKKAKEEKAARRAQAKSAQPTPSPATAGGAPATPVDGKGGKQKTPQASQQHGKLPARPAAPVTPAAPKEPRSTIPDPVSHLSVARRTNMTQADKDVHPAVLVLGQHMSTFSVSDSITRTEATLLAFKKVIDSYTTPHGTTFSRHFTSHVLNPQIDYLSACRPMCFAMGNAIRWLKMQISKVDIDLPDNQVKRMLCDYIDSFISERITYADFVIVNSAVEMIEDDEIVITYAHHHLVEKVLLKAKSKGKQFSVLFVDDPNEPVGKAHAKSLGRAGVDCTYISDPGAALSYIKDASRVLIAAEAMFSNGAMYARAGTCDLATAAAETGVRVVAMCETINFTERVAIDSLTYNEMDPECNSDEGTRFLFDTTTEHFIDVVVTELGNASPTSVPAILRKLEEL